MFFIFIFLEKFRQALGVFVRVDGCWQRHSSDFDNSRHAYFISLSEELLLHELLSLVWSAAMILDAYLLISVMFLAVELVFSLAQTDGDGFSLSVYLFVFFIYAHDG